MDDIPTVEEISGLNIFLYDVDIVEGSLVGELVRRSVQKHPSTVRLLRYNSHICNVANPHALFNAFSCPTCDCYFNRPGNLERHLTTCQERVKQVYPKSVYQLKETLFDKLDSFNIPYTDEQQLFKNVAIFDFESICVRKMASRHRDNKMDWKTCSDICINLLQLITRAHFYLQLQPS